MSVSTFWYAPLTGPESGALCVIALGGTGAGDWLKAAFAGRAVPAGSGRVAYGGVRAGDELLDEVLLIAPTGAAHWELSLHGSPAVRRRLTAEWSAAGARPRDAAPAGRRRVAPYRAALAAVSARAFAALWHQSRLPLVPPAPPADATAAGWAALADWGAARAADGRRLARLIAPFCWALVGPVNAGKSTLANVLSGAEHSLATPHPGTTTDPVAHDFVVNGAPVRVLDTAGFEAPAAALPDPTVRAAWRAAEAAAAAADGVLLVWDGAGPYPHALAAEVRQRRAPGAAWLEAALQADRRPPDAPPVPAPAYLVSARTGAGVEALRAALVEPRDDDDAAHAVPGAGGAGGAAGSAGDRAEFSEPAPVGAEYAWLAAWRAAVARRSADDCRALAAHAPGV